MPVNVWYSDTVLSDHNLAGFLSWASRSNIVFVEKTLQYVYLVEHKSIDLGVPTASPGFTRDGVTYQLSQFPCTARQCARCAEQRGGYQFRFVSPMWTQQWWILQPGSTTTEIRARRYQITHGNTSAHARGKRFVSGYAGVPPKLEWKNSEENETSREPQM